MNIARFIPRARRQGVLNNAFWWAVDQALKGITSHEEGEQRIAGLTASFLKQGWTPEEIRIAAQSRRGT